MHDLRLNKRVLVTALFIPCSREGSLVAHPARLQLGPAGGRERYEQVEVRS